MDCRRTWSRNRHSFSSSEHTGGSLRCVLAQCAVVLMLQVVGKLQQKIEHQDNVIRDFRGMTRHFFTMTSSPLPANLTDMRLHTSEKMDSQVSQKEQEATALSSPDSHPSCVLLSFPLRHTWLLTRGTGMCGTCITHCITCDSLWHAYIVV